MPTPQEFAPLAEAAFNARDIDALRALWTDDFHFVGPGGETRGADAMAAREHALWTAFPDMRGAIRTICASDDVAVLESTLSGTHKGPLALGGAVHPPSGRKVTLVLSVHLFFRDGRACGERVFLDQFDVLRQMGAIPEAA